MTLAGKKRELIERMADLREKKGLSYDDVALLGLIPAQLVEQIEKGMVWPSTGALKQIARALDVHLADLFQDVGLSQETISDLQPGQEVVLIRRSQRHKLLVRGSKALYEYLTPRGVERNLELLLQEVEPGAGGGDWLAHDGEECCLVLKGTFRIYVGEHVFDLAEGDTLWLKAHLRHKWENQGHEPATVLWAITPPWF